MKLFKFASIAFLIGFLTASCTLKSNAQYDDFESRTYEVNNFRKVYLEGGYKVILKQDDQASLTIKASDSDAFDYIDVDNDNEFLKLTVTKRHLDFERIILYITFKDLESLHIQGGVKLETKGYVDLDDFYLHVEGGAKIEMDLKANSIEVIGEGGVFYELKGVAEYLEARLSGAGFLDADELKTKEARIKIEGVGTASVYTTEELYAKIEGVGKIKYKGNPEVHKNIEGLGTISRD